MKANRIWQGVRLRAVRAAADPDAAPREITLPAAWEDAAADALAALAPGEGPVALPLLAEGWVRRLTADPALQAGLHGLLLHRRAAPCAPVWDASAFASPAGGDRGSIASFKLNLAGFADAALGVDLAAMVEACETLRQVAGAVGPTGLDDMLALLGLDYDSSESRDVAAGVLALVRCVFEGRAGAPVREPVRAEALPGLAEALAAACTATRGRGSTRLALLPPGPEDALLGVETVGIAPAFAATAGVGGLTRAAQRRLASRGMSLEAALAAALQGAAPLPLAGDLAARAMAEAVAPWLADAEAATVARSGSARREELPARRRGYTQKAAVGGHRLYVTTGEYADGRLGEVAVSLSKETPVVRGLMDSLAVALSIGLQHGVPLRAFVDAFAGTSFGPAGVVEGDPNVGAASSLPDYVVRTLAATYLGETLPEPAIEEPPALPLPLKGGQGRKFRVVA